MAFDIDSEIEEVIKTLERSELPWVGIAIRDYLSAGEEQIPEGIEGVDGDQLRRPYNRVEQVEKTIRLLELLTITTHEMHQEVDEIVHDLSLRTRRVAPPRVTLLDPDTERTEPFFNNGIGDAALKMADVIGRLRKALSDQ